jgi:hypothetical protein
LLGAAGTVAVFMLGSPTSAAIVDLNYDGVITQETDLTAAGTFVGDNNVFGDDNNNIFSLNAPIGAAENSNSYFTDAILQISNYSYALYNDTIPYISTFIFGYNINGAPSILTDYPSFSASGSNGDARNNNARRNRDYDDTTE